MRILFITSICLCFLPNQQAMQRTASRPMQACMRPCSTAVPIRRVTPPVGRALPAMAGPSDVKWSLDAVLLLQKYGMDQLAAMEVVGKFNKRLPSSDQLKAMPTKDDIAAAVEVVVKREVQASRMETRIELLLLALFMVFTTQPAVVALHT